MSRLYNLLLIIFILLSLGIAFFIFSDLPSNNQNEVVTQPSYKNISSKELKSYIDKGNEIYLLDVHIPEQTHIKGTNDFIPFNEIEKYQSRLPKDKNTEIVVYCRSGNMSEIASETLINLGYKNVKNLSGGINSWSANGYE